jgi:dTDP-4-amino-4,6-dideoxygalactose transaminase
VALPSDQDASGRTLGDEEIALLVEAIRSGTLSSTKGTFVKRLESEFASLLGVRHATACASGTSAIHAAIAAIDPEPGDEIVTSPITDMGALTPILYQGAIPVFADVEPDTGNLSAATIEARLSERTRAVIVTHLFGRPCEMAPILALARRHDLRVIEDCAQAFLARDDGRTVGTLGSIGCFSLQQGKHMTCGEGGLVVTDDDDLARRVFLFVNKAWGYGDAHPDHSFLALNGRMSELQGAVAVAQLAKLPAMVERRVEMAGRLGGALSGLPGVRHVPARAGSRATYWRFCLNVDGVIVPGGPHAMARALGADGIASTPRYIQKPAFQCEVFEKQRTFGSSRYPFTLARPEALRYDPANFPGVFALLDAILVLPWNERCTEAHVDHLARAIRRAAGQQ